MRSGYLLLIVGLAVLLTAVLMGCPKPKPEEPVPGPDQINQGMPAPDAVTPAPEPAADEGAANA